MHAHAPLVRLAGFAAVITAGSMSASTAEQPRVQFDLLPRSVVKNPAMDVTVITEATPEGRTLGLPTADQPAYYVHHAAGLRETGHAPAGTKLPDAAAMESQVRQQLAAAHFRPADATHLPTLVFISHWGYYNRLEKEFPDVGNREFLTRLSLIGGVKIAEEFRGVIQREEAVRGPGAGVPFGTTSLLSDYYRFHERDALTRRILDQARDDSYGFILSAYDFAALTRGERRLLWRTKISTDSSGLSLQQTLPALVAVGRDYFGRPMDRPETQTRRALDRERVEIGNLIELETAAAPAQVQEMVARHLGTLEQGLFDYGKTKRPDAKF